MKISREWAMPDKNTFNILPIKRFVNKYLKNSNASIDPFARDKRWATHTNDLNPKTKAEHHLDSVCFLKLLQDRHIDADLAMFDPPYSPEQMKRAYDKIGLKMGGRDALRTAGWKAEKDIIMNLISIGGYVLCFGWDSCGMGMKRGFAIQEILLVCHGAGHNDTICMAEKKISEQIRLW